MKVLVVIFMLSAVLYVSSCSYISHTGKSAFNKVKVGDSEATVIDLFGSPSVREKPELLYTRYTSLPCKEKCVERLWFENMLSIGIEAWSVQLDSSGNVIAKSYWMSP
jgi:hypothetical protein